MRLHLTEGEVNFLETHLRLTAMNERGQNAWHAERILDALSDARHIRRRHSDIIEIFADLYPEGGRE